MIVKCFGIDIDVVQVDENIGIFKSPKSVVHELSKCCRDVFQSLGHSDRLIETFMDDERTFLLIFFFHGNMPVSRD